MLAAIHDLFNHAGLRAAFLRARVPIGLAVVALVVWFAQPRWFWPGFAVSMCGQLIQLWSFASLNKNRDLACNGPYAVVRNPMYLGRFLILLGALMVLANGWVLAAFPVLYGFYMVNRVKREEARLRTALGAPYAAYCEAVRRFLPGAPYRGNTLLYWNWALLGQNNGWANLAGTLAFWVLAFLRLRFGA
jgi:protein-S-isoprenylcysteine O-methyltransferase Ste14